jgi:hypothetical protein
MSLSCIKSSLESYFMPCLFEDYISISNFCDLLSYPTMQVIILEYVDEIWTIATNPLRFCGFAPYIQFMIESKA